MHWGLIFSESANKPSHEGFQWAHKRIKTWQLIMNYSWRRVHTENKGSQVDWWIQYKLVKINWNLFTRKNNMPWRKKNKLGWFGISSWYRCFQLLFYAFDIYTKKRYVCFRINYIGITLSQLIDKRINLDWILDHWIVRLVSYWIRSTCTRETQSIESFSRSEAFEL